ncbi:TRPM8 channel-associated factor-like protein [Huso huso]|uniref:TRPM8 channel-associated factor-like protein n=1 Tax=Huso huso TaxID=61971 RepID=A0ABR0Z853_HUSHU
MDPTALYNSLIKGVEVFKFTGNPVPSELLLIGDRALPVAVNDKGQVLIAVSHYGRGRVAVLAHEGYLHDPSFGRFLQNAVGWLIPTPGASVGVQAGLESLVQHLASSGCSVKSAPFSASLGVYCMDAYGVRETKELIEFVKSGGGLLIAGQAWHWSSTHAGEDVLLAFPGNKVTTVSGIYFTAKYGDKGVFPVSRGIPLSSLDVSHGKDIKHDLKLLLDGVTDFNLNYESVPSALLVHGPLAFPIVLDRSNRAILAAAHYGKGRIVVLSHESQLSHPPLKKFVLNAVRWLGAAKPGKIGIQSNLTVLHQHLSEERYCCQLSELQDGMSVYCCTSYRDHQAAEIHEFVAEGGGLLIGGQAWWWSYSNTEQDAVAGYPGNKILNKFGISITASTLKNTVYRAPSAQEAARLYHFQKALSKFREHVHSNEPLGALEPCVKTLGRDCASFLRMKAHESPRYSMMCQILTMLVTKTGIPQASNCNPVRNPKEIMLLNLGTELYSESLCQEALVPVLMRSVPELVADPAVEVQVNGTIEGCSAWRSTGLFVSPGKTAHVIVPSAVTGAGWQVQTGCHSDDLSDKEELKRPPVVIRRFPINRVRTAVSSLWGGLLYIVVPAGSQLGPVNITVQGAVRAPFFKAGQSNISEWQRTVRHYAAPWAELEADSIILTVPSDSVRHLDNPEPLLCLWNRITRGIAELAARPHPFPRPERIVADVQICAGWMHSGYPIMLHLDSVKEIAHLDFMTSNSIWGPIHELGHNQQSAAWEFPPHTTEATCNLWSVYIHEKVLGTPRCRAHEMLRPKTRREGLRKYMRNGARLDQWEVWVCLETYLQLQEGFGWEPFIQLFSDYQQIPSAARLDKVSRMNLWAEKFSQQVKRNLLPFFKAWGWPIGKDLDRKLSALPAWKENPMKEYI